jgi:hypothetical protein
MRLGFSVVTAWLCLLAGASVPGCIGDEEVMTGGPSSGVAGEGGASAGAPGIGSGGTLPEVPPVGAGGSTGGSAPGSGGQVIVDPFPVVVTDPDQPCSITLTRSEVSPTITTVGKVVFETSAATSAATGAAASIEFGKTTDYGLSAPVELGSSGGKATLLGMATATVYHYRIVIDAGGVTCKSRDLTLETGPMPNGVNIGSAVLTAGSSSLPAQAGYIFGSNYNGSWVFIVNEAGELVWYYETEITNISSVRLAPDGRHVYARTLNVARAPQNGKVVRIAIDGSAAETMLLTASHHDFTFGPEGSIVYIRKSLDNTCDSLFLHWLGDPDDSEDELIADLDPLFSEPGPNQALGSETCHVNSVHYQADGGYTASDLVHNAYVKLDDLGQMEWILGGGVDATFEGDGNVWERQHGHHLVAPDRLLFFNNQTSAAKASRALEVVLDFEAGSATYAPFEYTVPGVMSTVLGDVRRLPNGNTLVTYSVGTGILHEVDPYGVLVRTIDFPGGACGYTDFHESLYEGWEP